MANKVVLVPGLMGSRLDRAFPDNRQEEVWFNRGRLLIGQWKYMQLADDGVSPGPLADGVALQPSLNTPAWGGWAELTSKLQSEGWETDFWAWDWRKSIRLAAALLAAHLIELSVTQEFYVLTHSLGGLVARLAYPQYTASANPARWKRTLYVCTPHYGSHQSAQYLARPIQNLDWLGTLMSGLVGLFGFPTNPLLLGVLNGKLRTVVASWPALYECLPSIKAPWVDTRPLDPRLYQAGSYAAENASVRQHWLDEAQVTRTAIDSTLDLPRPPERGVVGVGTPAPDKLIKVSDLYADSSYEDQPGDGTVPVARATLDGANNKLSLMGAIHADVLGLGGLLNRATSLLLDDDPTPVTAEPLKPRILPAPPPPILTTIEGPAFPAIQIRGDP